MLLAFTIGLFAVQGDDGMRWPVNTEFVPMHAKPAGYWIARDYLIGESTPDLVIFGDSQLGGLRSADAKVAGKKLDFVLDHRSYSLESCLKANGFGPVETFVAAQPGSVISDFYIMSKSLFVGRKKPKAVAIAVSPRVFLTNGLHYPGDSQYFRYFAPHADSRDVDTIAYPNLGNKTHAWLKNTLHMPVELLEPGQFQFLTEDPQTYNDKLNIYPSNFQFELEHCKHQMRCLKELIAFLNENNISCTVVEMPMLDRSSVTELRQLNHELMPELEALCAESNAQFIDLSNDGEFIQSDFLDPVHLSQIGGLTFSSVLAQAIAENRVCSGLNKNRHFVGVKATTLR